jgi:hypothetical protein
LILLTAVISSEAQAEPLIGLHQDATYCAGPAQWNAAATDAEYTRAQVSRGEIQWRCIEPNAPVNGVHQYNWSSLDGAINALNAKGIPTVGFIEWPPQWASGSTDFAFVPWTASQSTWNTFVSRYATFAAAVAERYKGKNVYYEIWNEPNERYFWHPAPETNKTLAITRYGQLFSAARTAMLAKDPAAKVALGGITGLTAGCCILGVQYMEGLIQRGVAFDYAGIHAYTENLGDPGPGSYYDAPIAVYNMLQKYPSHKNVKLWLTEFGAFNSNTLGQKTQADYVETTFRRADNGFEGRIPGGVIQILNYFLDRDQPAFNGAGLFTASGARKQSADRMRAYNTGSGGDTIPPTVSITAPPNGATIRGVFTIAANASDNVGVVGVQFKLDGANAGTEDTTAPYSRDFGTVGWPNRTYTWTAVARDAAGNKTTSAPIKITVAN